MPVSVISESPSRWRGGGPIGNDDLDRYVLCSPVAKKVVFTAGQAVDGRDQHG